MHRQPGSRFALILVISALVSFIAGCITVEDHPTLCNNRTTNATSNLTIPIEAAPPPEPPPPPPPQQLQQPDVPPGPIAKDETPPSAASIPKQAPNLSEKQNPAPPPTPTPAALPRTSKSLQEIPTKRVTEGEMVSFPNLQATDLDGDQLRYTFSSPLDSQGRWLTKKGDAGIYTLTITVTDGKTTTSQQVKVIVLASNRPPVLSPTPPIIATEGQTIELEPDVADPDGDDISITITGWQTRFPYTTTFSDQGNHTVIVTASDQHANTTATVLISVKNVNRPPHIQPLPNANIKEGDNVTFSATTSDPDNDPVTITYSKPVSSDGRYEARKGHAGTYPVTVTASDGSLNASTRFILTVSEANLPPVLTGVRDITLNEGGTLRPDITATDPENQSVTITYSGFMDSPTKELSYSDAGIHEVKITATDGENTVVAAFTVNVTNVNRPPMFNPEAFQ